MNTCGTKRRKKKTSGLRRLRCSQSGWLGRSPPHLRGRADEAWPGRARPVLDAAEDAGDPVGLGEEGRVADGEGRAQAQAPHRADGGRGLGEEEERHGVGHEDPRQEDVAQFPARSLHQGRVVVPDEHPGHQAGAQEPGGRDNY